MLTSQHVATDKSSDAQFRAQLALRDDAIAFLRTRVASGPILPSCSPLDGEPLIERLPDAPPASALSSRPAVVILPGFDWDFRYHRPQYLARHFAQNGYRVFFLSMSRYARGKPYVLKEREPEVFETTMGAPHAFDAYGDFDPATVDLIVDSFGVLQRDLQIESAHLLVVFPTWAPVATQLRARFGWPLIYDCIDEWEHTPGLGPSIRQQEEALVRTADLTVFSAEWLADKWRAVARRSVIARNGVDVNHYRACAPNDLVPGLAHPVIGYFGTIAARIDVPLLIAIARHRPDATLLLAGGLWDVSVDDLDPLLCLPNVRYLGERPHDEMPLLLWHFDVCLLPYYVNPATEAGNPVKLYEYLAGGKPIVGTRLTELVPFDGLCYLADSHDELVAKVDAALEECDLDLQQRRKAAAAQNDWSTRYRAIQQAMDDLPASAHGDTAHHAGGPVEPSEPWARSLSLVAASVLERDEYIRHLQAELDDRTAWARALLADLERQAAWGKEAETALAEGDQYVRHVHADLEAQSARVDALETVAVERAERIAALEARLAKSTRQLTRLRPASARGRLWRAAMLLLGRA